jgi:hypothetical protein
MWPGFGIVPGRALLQFAELPLERAREMPARGLAGAAKTGRSSAVGGGWWAQRMASTWFDPPIAKDRREKIGKTKRLLFVGRCQQLQRLNLTGAIATEWLFQWLV